MKRSATRLSLAHVGPCVYYGAVAIDRTINLSSQANGFEDRAAHVASGLVVGRRGIAHTLLAYRI